MFFSSEHKVQLRLMEMLILQIFGAKTEARQAKNIKHLKKAQHVKYVRDCQIKLENQDMTSVQIHSPVCTVYEGKKRKVTIHIRQKLRFDEAKERCSCRIFFFHLIADCM